jgi:hypothetical protein
MEEESMERIKIRLTIDERDLILNHTFVGDYLSGKLLEAKVEGKYIQVAFTVDELDDLAGFIAAEANHMKDKILEKKLEDLYDKISNIENEYL